MPLARFINLEKNMQSMIVVDTETTGLDPKKHSIVSMGAVDFSNPEYQFYQECRIFDGAEITSEALEINGFFIEQIIDKNRKSLEEAVKEFFSWSNSCADRTLAGENPSFDRDFLRASAERYGISWAFGYRTVDMHSLCYSHYLRRGLNPPSKNERTDLDTDKILNYVGLPSEPKPHHALTGVKMEAEALSRIIYGKPLLKEFEKYEIPDYLIL